MNAQRYRNFALSVSSLREYVTKPITDKRDLSGVVWGFGMAFELAWKCVQDAVADRGYTQRGPKPALQAALQAGIIPAAEESVWSQMLEDRNLAAHTYNEALAREIVDRISATHLPALESLVQTLSAD